MPGLFSKLNWPAEPCWPTLQLKAPRCSSQRNEMSLHFQCYPWTKKIENCGCRLVEFNGDQFRYTTLGRLFWGSTDVGAFSLGHWTNFDVFQSGLKWISWLPGTSIHQRVNSRTDCNQNFLSNSLRKPFHWCWVYDFNYFESSLYLIVLRNKFHEY